MPVIIFNKFIDIVVKFLSFHNSYIQFLKAKLYIHKYILTYIHKHALLAILEPPERSHETLTVTILVFLSAVLHRERNSKSEK